MRKINLKRYIYNADVRNIIGDLIVDDKFFCYTLEDEIRADGVKEYGETCIPAGEYKVKLTWSPKYKTYLPLIYNTPDLKIVGPPHPDTGEVQEWSGVRFHGGNTEKDTLGCPLVAHNTDGKKIWGTASGKLKGLMKKGVEYDLLIENVPFSYEGRFSN